VFDLYGNDRLTKWKEIRDSIETSEDPFNDVISVWSRAPFVNAYLNHHDKGSWPDPWHLILDGKLDDLAICLGMLYTLKLTQRFIRSTFEIHMSMPHEQSDKIFYLVVDNSWVLSHQTKEVKTMNDFNIVSEKICTITEIS
jgi:hypothetical protein